MKEKATKTMDVTISIVFLLIGFLTFADGNILLGLIGAFTGGILFVLSE
jgi:hypothetical protein